MWYWSDVDEKAAGVAGTFHLQSPPESRFGELVKPKLKETHKPKSLELWVNYLLCEPNLLAAFL